MSKGKWFLVVFAVVVALVAFRGSPERDALETCVADRAHAGFTQVDYAAAYDACRR